MLFFSCIFAKNLGPDHARKSREIVSTIPLSDVLVHNVTFSSIAQLSEGPRPIDRITT
jgi:hypothetical protein